MWGQAAGSAAAGASIGLGPIGALAAPIIGGLFGRKGQKDANRTNLQIARENRAFQERMSSTAYQRAANDLEAAGLNRILALGKPSSTPAGSMATMLNEEAAIQQGVESGVNSGMAARRLKKELDMMNWNVNLLSAQTEKADQERHESYQRTQAVNKENDIRDLTIAVYRKFPWLRGLQMMGSPAQTAVGTAKNILSLAGPAGRMFR